MRPYDPAPGGPPNREAVPGRVVEGAARPTPTGGNRRSRV